MNIPIKPLSSNALIENHKTLLAYYKGTAGEYQQISKIGNGKFIMTHIAVNASILNMYRPIYENL